MPPRGLWASKGSISSAAPCPLARTHTVVAPLFIIWHFNFHAHHLAFQFSLNHAATFCLSLTREGRENTKGKRENSAHPRHNDSKDSPSDFAPHWLQPADIATRDNTCREPRPLTREHRVLG